MRWRQLQVAMAAVSALPGATNMSDDQTPKDANSSPPAVGGAFASEVLALGGGAAVAHLIAFACTPIISRLFAPEAFGAADIFASAVLVIGVVSSLRYESALMLPADDREAASLLVVSCLSVALITAATCLAVAMFGDGLAAAIRASQLARYKWLLPVGVFSWGIGLPLRTWAARHKRFKSLAAVSVAETATSSGMKIVAGWAGILGAGPLIVTGVLARAVPPVILACRTLARDAGIIISGCSWRRMLDLARRYVRFPLIDSWSAVLGQLCHLVPLALLGAWLGTGIVGHYSRALLLTRIPLLLAGNAVRQVFFQRAAEARAAGKGIADMVDEVFARLVWIAALPTAMVALIGPELFRVVLGRQWGDAGSYARILAAWLLLEALAVPLSGLISVLGRLTVGLAFRVALLVSQAGGLIVGGWLLGDPRASIALLAVAGAAVNAGLCWFLLASAGASIPRAGACLVRYLAYCGPALAVAAIAKWWLDMPDWQVVLAAAVGSLSYVALVLHHDRWARSKLAELVSRAAGRRP